MVSQESNGKGTPEAVLQALNLLAQNTAAVATGIHQQNQLLLQDMASREDLREAIKDLSEGIDEISDVAAAFNGFLGRVHPREAMRMPAGQILSILAKEFQDQMTK